MAFKGVKIPALLILLTGVGLVKGENDYWTFHTITLVK